MPYSAIKIKAKLHPLYSTLKPDTSSDSPSAKSKGVRFVSATQLINQIINSTGANNKTGMPALVENIEFKLIV
jgi:hypothetical protein